MQEKNLQPSREEAHLENNNKNNDWLLNKQQLGDNRMTSFKVLKNKTINLKLSSKKETSKNDEKIRTFFFFTHNA